MCHAACTLFIGPDVQAKAFAHAVAGTLLACIQAVLKNAQGSHTWHKVLSRYRAQYNCHGGLGLPLFMV